MGKRSLSEKALLDRLGLDWKGLIGQLEAEGATAWSVAAIRAYLRDTFDLPPWWQTAIVAEVDTRLRLGITNRQRNGLYRQTSQRRLSGTVAELFESFCKHFAAWVSADREAQLAEGARLTLSDCSVIVTDLDDVGWIRLERWHGSVRSVIHCSFRPSGTRTLISFAESDIRDQSSCHKSSEQWLSVLDSLSAATSPS